MSLPLDSPNWHALVDAYGSGQYVPEWLRRLEGLDPDALGELYGRICHQGSVYSSSIAALPHLVRIAQNCEDDEFRAEVLALVGAICESYDFAGALSVSSECAEIPAVLGHALDMAEMLLPKLDEANTSIYLLKSVAALSGYVGVSRVLEGFADEEFFLACANCGTELYVWPDEADLVVSAEDPVSNPDSGRTRVACGPFETSGHVSYYGWLEEQVSTAPGLAGVASLLPSLFGRATCPKCQVSFDLFDSLMEAA